MLLYISHYFELSLQIGCADLLVRQHYSNLFQYLLFYQLCSYLLQNAINILWSLSRISRDRQTNGGLQGLKTTNFLKHGSKSIIKLLPDELFLNSAGLDEHAALWVVLEQGQIVEANCILLHIFFRQLQNALHLLHLGLVLPVVNHRLHLLIFRAALSNDQQTSLHLMPLPMNNLQIFIVR